jgi:hypothetical protein
MMFVETPADRVKIDPSVENRVEVKKVCQFLGHSDIYVVGEIKSGVVMPNMKGNVGSNCFEVIEMESKIGNRIAKQGLTVGLTLKGIPKEAVQQGSVFTLTQ